MLIILSIRLRKERSIDEVTILALKENNMDQIFMLSLIIFSWIIRKAIIKFEIDIIINMLNLELEQ